MKTGAELIADERKRQIETEGWTPEHDDQHAAGEIADAASCYLMDSGTFDDPPADEGDIPGWWPWDVGWWKPSKDRVRNLVKAGALIAAEIDRLQRMSPEEVRVAEAVRKLEGR
jgi:hypothetical protein